MKNKTQTILAGAATIMVLILIFVLALNSNEMNGDAYIALMIFAGSCLCFSTALTIQTLSAYTILGALGLMGFLILIIYIA